jgi:Zn-dependent protease with chaperone function
MSRWVAKRAYNVQIVSIRDYDNLNLKQKIVFDVVNDLASRNNIKMPEVGFYISQDPNAFAT